MSERKVIESKQFKKGHTYLQWLFVLLANITLFAYGVECGWISPTTKILQSKDSPTGAPLSDYMISWIASAMSMAAIVGVSLYTYIADAYGRKMGILFVAIPEAISWIIKLSYSSTTTLIIARLFSGLAAGGCFNVIPMYVKEISQDDMRGILGTLSQLMQTIGMLFMYLIGAYLDYYTVIMIVMGLPIITCVLLVKAPESPAYLVKLGKIDEARKTVARLRGLDEDDKVIQSIVESMKNEDYLYKSLPSISIFGILKDKAWRHGFFLVLMNFVFHGLNGSYAITTYASAILVSTGVEFDINPEIQTLSFPIVMIMGSLSLVAVVERFGRKPLLIGVYVISSISMATIALLMILQEQGHSIPGWLPVIAMTLAVTMYGAGVASLPYIIMTEMFSFQIRAKVVGTVITFAWMMTCILVTIYVPMANNFGSYSPFIFYAVVNLAGAIFTLLFVPETRGKTEEEIYQIFRKKTKTDTAS